MRNLSTYENGVRGILIAEHDFNDEMLKGWYVAGIIAQAAKAGRTTKSAAKSVANFLEHMDNN